MSTHQLIIVRHCKASHNSPGTDEKRPLTEAGKAQAAELGRQLKERIQALDTVFVSPALRAQQTWEGMASGAGVSDASKPRVKTVEVIYDGSPMQILEAVRLGSTGYASMVVGHEPTVSSLVTLVAKDGEAEQVGWGMSTGSAAIVEASKDWHEWHQHVASLVDVVRVSSGG